MSTRAYQDPLDLVWLATAARLNMRVERSAEVFASWDGVGTLTLSTPEHLDPDDCLAQMILHEICHALVQGPENLTRPDWGLDNFDDRDLVREHACHRLQAALLQPHGLRAMLTPTTVHRPYYESLPADPLADADDPAVAPAREGFARAFEVPWAEPLVAALTATAVIAAVVEPFAAPPSIWALTD